MLTSLKAGVGAALIVGLLLGFLENFNFDVTGRSLAAGAITALLTLMVIAIASGMKRLRY